MVKVLAAFALRRLACCLSVKNKIICTGPTIKGKITLTCAFLLPILDP